MRHSVDFGLFFAFTALIRLAFCDENVFIFHSTGDCSSQEPEMIWTPTKKDNHTNCFKPLPLAKVISINITQVAPRCDVTVYSDLDCTDNPTPIHVGNCGQILTNQGPIPIMAFGISHCKNPVPVTAAYTPTLSVTPTSASSTATSTSSNHHSNGGGPSAKVLGPAISIPVVFAIAVGIAAFLWFRRRKHLRGSSGGGEPMREISTVEAGGAGAGAGTATTAAAAGPTLNRRDTEEEQPIGEPKEELGMPHEMLSREDSTSMREMLSREDSSSVHELDANPEKTILNDKETST